MPSADPDTVLGSELCAQCPYSPAGCCVAPPRYDWSDLGRVVTHGGLEWLLARVADGSLRPVEHGYALTRVKRRVLPTHGSPRLAKCVFHDGASGCTIDPKQRPATCNFYLCDSALESRRRREGAEAEALARRVHDELVGKFTRWDAELDARVRAEWPLAERVSAPFLSWLGAQFERLRST